MAEKKEATEATAPEATAVMQHEFVRYVHRVAIGDEWFDVDADGRASFPLRLLAGAELAGFRRVT